MPEPTTDQEIFDAVCAHFEALGAEELDAVGCAECADLVRSGALKEAQSKMYEACAAERSAAGGAEGDFGEPGSRMDRRWDVTFYLYELLNYRHSGQPSVLVYSANYLERWGTTGHDVLAMLLAQADRADPLHEVDQAQVVVEAWKSAKAAVA